MQIAQRVDEYGKAGWITLMVLSFIIFWPIGLAILGYMLWSGRMGSWMKASHKAPGKWYDYSATNRDTVSRCSMRKHRRHGLKPTGNAAFDEYREQTMQRLEEEQQQFQDYLERLRQARDKEEFDSFMAERKAQADKPDTPEDEAPQPAA